MNLKGLEKAIAEKDAMIMIELASNGIKVIVETPNEDKNSKKKYKSDVFIDKKFAKVLEIASKFYIENKKEFIYTKDTETYYNFEKFIEERNQIKIAQTEDKKQLVLSLLNRPAFIGSRKPMQNFIGTLAEGLNAFFDAVKSYLDEYYNKTNAI